MSGVAEGSFDVAVIGAGIAGASLAAELAPHVRVVLLERESQPGYHTTGRSAALFSETYGPPAIRALSRASGPLLRQPPAGFASAPLLTPRGVLIVGRPDQAEAVEGMLAEIAAHGDGRSIGADEAQAMMPLLKPGYVGSAILEEDGSDMDVHAIHHGYLRRMRELGGRLLANAEIVALARENGRWRVDTRNGRVDAGIVVNAAGAWADEIGAMAGARPIGLTPKRRTAMMVAAPEGARPDAWPMVVDVEEQFYLKPDAGRLLISPADETPSPPCDAQPDELDIAICVDRIETAFDIAVRRIENKWAGLRSFVADKVPVAGYDGRAENFFWLAAQGGYGIQTAPALARLAAALVLGRTVPSDITDQGVAVAELSPRRLERTA